MRTKLRRFLTAREALRRMRAGDLPTQGGGYTSALYFDDGARTTGPTGARLVRAGLIDRPTHTSIDARYTLVDTKGAK